MTNEFQQIDYIAVEKLTSINDTLQVEMIDSFELYMPVFYKYAVSNIVYKISDSTVGWKFIRLQVSSQNSASILDKLIELDDIFKYTDDPETWSKIIDNLVARQQEGRGDMVKLCDLLGKILHNEYEGVYLADYIGYMMSEMHQVKDSLTLVKLTGISKILSEIDNTSYNSSYLFHESILKGIWNKFTSNTFLC